jgi:hypothetical protein
MIKQFLAICIICSGFCFSQERYITDEEFKEKITWLLPNEENLALKKVLYKIHGYNKDRGGFEVDGILYYNLPYILSSRVKYIEIHQTTSRFSRISKCECSLIIKTIVTGKEFNSRKNILHRLNKNRIKNEKKKKKYGIQY